MKPIIRIENISKQYSIGEQQKNHTLLREYLSDLANTPLRLFKGQFKDRKNHFWALRDVGFDVYPGEVVGILGRNGAGKSTLLKIISRITEPTTGRIELYGRIGSLLEVGTGFHPDLTGRENIYLNGTILGMKRDEISGKFDEIVEFAGIGTFLDTAVKHYSSGMYMRLAFAVAAHLETEILIVDEVLAVGDADFQNKCLGKMAEVNRDGRTILFVSHNIGTARQICSKGIYLQDGQVKFEGTIDRTIDYYHEQSSAMSKAYVRAERQRPEADEAKAMRFEKISLHTRSGLESYDFGTDEPIVFEFEIEIFEFDKKAVVYLMILTKDKMPVCAFQSETVKNRVRLVIEPQFLVRGEYSIHASIHFPANYVIDNVDDVISFKVHEAGSVFNVFGDYNYGLVFGRGRWS